MPCKRLPKRFMIKAVRRVTILVNFIPMKGGVYAAMLPQEIVIGKKFQVPKHKIGEYIQAYFKATNDTSKECIMDSLQNRRS